MSDNVARTRQHLDALAAKTGRIVVFPAQDELFIDIDGPDAAALFDKNFAILEACLAEQGERIEIIRRSRSQRRFGQHIVVRLPYPIDEQSRCMFQAFLGSDATRELLGWIRCMAGDGEPSCFFEKEMKR